MPDEAENPVLAHLRTLRADIYDLRKEMHEVKARLGSVERRLATLPDDLLRITGTVTDLARRVTRLE
jgi:hypothetical protein